MSINVIFIGGVEVWMSQCELMYIPAHSVHSGDSKRDNHRDVVSQKLCCEL